MENEIKIIDNNGEEVEFFDMGIVDVDLKEGREYIVKNISNKLKHPREIINMNFKANNENIIIKSNFKTLKPDEEGKISLVWHGNGEPVKEKIQIEITGTRVFKW